MKKFINNSDREVTLAAAFHMYCEAKNIYEEAGMKEFSAFCRDIETVMECHAGEDVYNSQSADPFEDFQIIDLPNCGTSIYVNVIYGYVDIRKEDKWLYDLISIEEDGCILIAENDLEEWLDCLSNAYIMFSLMRSGPGKKYGKK